MTVYILELDEPIGDCDNPRGQARYYVGWCAENREYKRLKEHVSGKGSRMIAAAIEQGRSVAIVAVIHKATIEDEAIIKAYKGVRRLLEKWLTTRRYYRPDGYSLKVTFLSPSEGGPWW